MTIGRTQQISLHRSTTWTIHINGGGPRLARVEQLLEQCSNVQYRRLWRLRLPQQRLIRRLELRKKIL